MRHDRIQTPARPSFSRLRRLTTTLAIALVSTVTPRARAADEIVAPVLTHEVAPTWPEARGEVHDVVVPVTLEITPDGAVSSVQVEASVGAEYDAAAVRAAREWRFSPATRNGAPVASRIRAVVRFRAVAPEPVEEPSPHVLESRRSAAESAAAPNAPKAPSIAPSPTAPSAALPRATPTETAAPPPEAALVTVVGRASASSRGGSDYRVHVGALSYVPRANATELLRLAPGVFLSNEGGEGHAQRIYLRGFDAREGQDVELTVGGVPINDSGNPHGNGVAEAGFIIPEVVHELRVLEGPFDPRQGNYAVAGSADYELGLDRRGYTAKYTRGTYGTERALLLWGPPGESIHTFGAAELYRTDGFGQNRDARRASALGQYEGRLGERGTWRFSGGAYAADYHTAGLLREDDVAAGRKGFFDTYDTRQGGASSRFQAAGDVESRAGDSVLHQQVFVIERTSRIRENFTGFLLDTQEAIQEPHEQRGDLLDTSMQATTFGGRGWARSDVRLLGQTQSFELGYFARMDRVSAMRQRLSAASDVPYKTESNFDSSLGDIGLYADASLRATPWLAVRGGVRGDLFAYDVLDNCAAKDVSRPSAADSPVDQSCLDQQRFGVHREPDQRATTASTRAMPRATLILGPVSHFSLSLAYGLGVRSIDPNYVTQDVKTPFASIRSTEGGVTYAHTIGSTALEAKSVFFSTHVDKDHIFSETEGRSVIGGGTTRTGWSGSARVTGNSFDESANVTLVRSSFDDTHLLVPYAPDVVVRSDTAVFGDLPVRVAGHGIRGALGLGGGYVGRRALPYGQRSDTIFTLDTSGSLAYRALELELSVTNLLDNRYRIAEYNYVSDFNSAPAPTLVPARHFAAGAPRMIFLSLALHWGGGQ
jgi:iron complex outermembrane receptor protein